METFGKHLLQFAHSVDIVSVEVLIKVRDMVVDYLKKVLDIEFCEILVPIPIDGRNGLKSEWSPEGSEWARSIKDNDGKYNGQISYAWDKQRNIIWVVSESGSEDLIAVGTYRDLLHPHDSKNIPKFVSLTQSRIKTSIICMLPHDKLNIGVLNLESTKYLKASANIQKEIEYIRVAMGLLMGLYKTNVIQGDTTTKAINALGEFKELPFSGDLKIFFSFSKRADPDIIEAINKAIEPYDINIQDWQNDYNNNNIPDQIWENISKSEFGICYLSEPAEAGSKYQYQDNYNVIFETGMMHCLTRLKKIRKYILVRESKSPDPPFNFIVEKILFVPRDEAGNLKKDTFITNLQKIFNQQHVPKRV